MAITIAVDAMGGDNAPLEIIKGTIISLELHDDLNTVLVGDTSAIENTFKELDEEINPDRISLVNAEQVVGMDESPKKALKEKPDASITVAMKLIKEGKADALVSAGNTGAVILAAAQNLPIIHGIERTGLAAIYPVAKFYRKSKGFALMLDVGATIHCTSRQLVHFAFMGSYYVKKVLDIPDPHVALLNIGEEETKGGEVLTKAYKYLKEAEDINFIGNIEGKDIPKGIADVVVTEGFVGNVVLKMLEGVSDVAKDMGKYAFKQKLSWKIGLAFLRSGMKRLKVKTDYSEYGGAPILGFEKLVIKAHGRSNAKAISNAINVAKRSAEEDVCTHIADSITKFNATHQMDLMEI
ncbi:MAG TPA: phosphate acyltransferase PlsX [Caldithrix abyssi]|uniref:Phosphate acyltransferase n=1 Tax=Caldithrix abyssi TaxID=187145 RepID=A0A7V4WTY6_CALAY|nr:phosphate acyltransferase PlsX [Caldithrix abyssi]